MISIFESHEATALAAADLVADHIASRPLTSIGLSGGSTPAATYRALAARSIDWDGVTLWLGDERWVPHDHPESNTAMVRSTLGAAAARLLAPDHDLGDPEVAAAAYEVAVRAGLALSDGDGRPHLVLLGMGEDGHTASLFPGTAALAERERVYVANWLPDRQVWRLTATLPLLREARRVVFLVTGSGKADMVRRVVAEGAPYPAAQVAGAAEEVTWLLDRDAASLLDT